MKSSLERKSLLGVHPGMCVDDESYMEAGTGYSTHRVADLVYASATLLLLDLVLTTHPNFISTITYLPSRSDHLVVHFSLHIPLVSPKVTIKHIRDYSRADFTSINSELSQFLDDYLPNFSNRSVESNWVLFKNVVAFLTEKYILSKKILCNTNSPRFNTTLRRLRNWKKKLFRAAKRSSTDARWAAYHKAEHDYTSTLKETKLHFFNHTLTTTLATNPKQFWSVINPNFKSDVSLQSSDGTSISFADCATVLNDVFRMSFSACDVSRIPALSSTSFLPMNPVTVDDVGVTGSINNMKLSSCAGIDGINSKFFFKNCNVYCFIIPSSIYTQSLNLGVLPSDWLVGKVAPLHKSGVKHNPLNYRPISLTSVPCKIFEHVIYSQLVNFLESNNFFTTSQHGFGKHLSCETQLISFTYDLHHSLV